MFSANAEALVDVPFGGSLRAGFPSPAQDYTSEAINLGKILVRDNETTFYARVEGNSMCEAGICDGDLVVIDKSIEASEGDIVAAFIDGEFTLKRFHVDTNEGCAWLMPANADFKPIKVKMSNGEQSVIYDSIFVNDKYEQVETVTVYQEVLRHPEEALEEDMKKEATD